MINFYYFNNPATWAW